MTDPREPTSTVENDRAQPLVSADALHAYIPYLVSRIANRWNINQNRDLADRGTNNIIIRTLSILHIFRTLTVNEIAALAATEQSSTSRMIDSMVAGGLVERHISETDLRRRDIAITQKGEQLLEECWPIMRGNYDRLVEGIDKDELAIARRVLGQMVDNIRENAI